MKKLLITLACTIIIIPQSFCCVPRPKKIEFNQKKDVSTPENFPDDLKKMILLELSQNCHRYTIHYENMCSKEATRIIFYVSLVNKDLYKELDKYRNDPIAARDIITNIQRKNNFTTCFFVDGFTFPGAQKCLKLSRQLYKIDLTENDVEILFRKGAIIDFTVTENIPDRSRKSQSCPLRYWYKKNNQPIMKKLLDLGANPNGTDLLSDVVAYNNIDITQLLLNYHPKITAGAWQNAMSEKIHEYLDLLLSHATQDELNDGLVCCFNCNDNNIIYRPDIMQKYIDNGANPDIALSHLMKRLTFISKLFEPNKLTPNPFKIKGNFVKVFQFLCKQKAFDQEALAELQQIQNTVNSLVSQLEQNQPSGLFNEKI
ncbi:MAG TPA: hypothetical protein VHX42_00425 [Candidatus Babeliales bacterium]|jgi:hypothetical protein|nr:hypothetical protein [Candidatus Babeliales bacterium]